MIVSELYVYPIKACRGVAVDQAELTRRGLAQDRRYMLVDGSGRFISQRERARLALFHTAFASDQIVVNHSSAPQLLLPLTLQDGPRRRVTVWRDEVSAIVHERGSAWFSERLGEPVQLVFMPDEVERQVNPERGLPGDIVSFADAYPLLLIGQSSLDALNSRLQQPLVMRRFRPNVVVSGAAPHAEDEWRTLRIGDVPFRAPKLCDRCVVTTIDPETGHKGTEPLATLARYRKWDGKVWFGTNIIPDVARGVLRVGDAVTGGAPEPITPETAPPGA